jgi:hypothetical protein
MVNGNSRRLPCVATHNGTLCGKPTVTGTIIMQVGDVIDHDDICQDCAAAIEAASDGTLRAKKQ